MEIIIFTDSIESWFVDYGKKLQNKMEGLGHSCSYVFNKEEKPIVAEVQADNK